ncbi:hypothetical protein GOP47_0026011 [Adiantum capillus-veneris]|uniref:Protein kinase domain-containing protein n=1 Tax=Adiantum capillus-veneris TaxID=13818 RepID=A0A9D4Z433_ADICA|nr:hypothetical protein GOP47_0026011 [Adiantum capillus-veneris]
MIKISFLPSMITFCAKKLKDRPCLLLKSFDCESSIDLIPRGIVQPLAHTFSPPWILIFPFFNGGSLGNLMEILPHPHGSLCTMLAKQVGKGKVVEPVESKTLYPDDIRHAKSLSMHVSGVIHALVQALAHAHPTGVLHTDLHPWNVMLDFTEDGILRVGIIDWGLALRMALEKRPTNIVNALEHELRPRKGSRAT